MPTLSETELEIRIDDLIEVPPVKTVVQLSDLADTSLRRQMAESFVLTDEVRSYFHRFLGSLEAGTGFAAFLRGHFGTGKSHFLAFLDLVLTDDAAPERIQHVDPELAVRFRRGARQTAVVAAVSLVDHSAQESLEHIVSDAFTKASGPAPLPFLDDKDLEAHIDTFRYHLAQHHSTHLDLFLLEHGLTEAEFFSPDHLDLLEVLSREVRYAFRPDPGRDVRFAQLFDEAEQRGRPGVVLLLDELSEFLHAKRGAPLAEDIRFLQYLGELTAVRPFYVVAAIQEYLEAAEYGLPGEQIRKIKDRYPNAFELSSSHIEEVVAQRLIRHKPGADKVIQAVYARLHEALRGFPIPADRFIRVYPVHPATTILLDRLKPLLSRGRGILDFIHYRLRGSEARGIPGMLDAPADRLLTPDVIFDHFRSRIRENVEIADYETTVFAWYERHLEALFPEDDKRKLAERLVKLLILLAISPEPRPYSVKTLAQALLVRVSHLDPNANVRMVLEILERLVSQGAYVTRVPRRPGAAPSFDDVYRISLKADLTVLVNRRVEAALASLADAPPIRIYENLAPALELESLPFHQLAGRGPQSFVIQWQRTPREGIVVLGGLNQVGVATLTSILAKLGEDALDWALFIGVTYDVEAQRIHTEQTLLPALRRARDPSARAILFWLPRDIGFEGQDGAFLRETLARRAALAQAGSLPRTSQTHAFAAHLEKALENDRHRIEGIFHRAYYQGRIVSIAGEEEDISTLGRPLFEQTLLAVFTPVLSARYPDHHRCAPLGRPPTLDDVQAIVENFFRPGTYRPSHGDTDRLATRLVSLLRPLGLIKKQQGLYMLSPDIDKPGPARTLLDMLDNGPHPLNEVQNALRKGTFGLTAPMFQLLTLGLAFSGTLTCYSGGVRRDPAQIGALTFGQIDAVARTELAELDLSPLAALPVFADKTALRGSLTPRKQARIWKQIQEVVREIAHLTEAVREGIRRIPPPHRERLDLGALEDDAKLLDHLREAAGSAPSPAKGIEAFVLAVQRCPVCNEAYTNLKEAAQFFHDRLDRYLVMSRYCELIGDLPSGLRFAPLRQKLEEVLEGLGDRRLPVNAGRFKRLEAAFRGFRATYVEAYAAAHEQSKGPERFAPLLALRRTETYRVLEALASLTALAAGTHKDAIDRKIDGILAQQCRALSRETLMTHPFCRCGFRLGQEGSPPPATALDEALNEAVEHYLNALARGPNVAALRRAEKAQRELGRDETARALAQVVAVLEAVRGNEAPAAVSAAQLLPHLDDDVLSAMDTALRAVSHVRDRSLPRLIDMLQDRCLSGDEAIRVFHDWLAQDDDVSLSRTYFRFVRDGRADSKE